MTSLDNISRLSKQYDRKIKELTAPLLQQFGITYFARQSVSNDGYWEILGNLPDWLDHSASKGFYKVDPSLLHPDHYQSGLVVNSSYTAPDFLKNMTNECLKFYHLDHCLCIFEKTPTGCEWYFFATSAENRRILNIYITKIASIYKYINYFNQEAKNLLHKNLDFRINIANLKNDPFFSNKNILDLSSFSFINNNSISPREKDCLIYLSRGKTVKETAKILGLSPRTVEEYLNRLKQKTGCQYKRELIDLFHTFH